MRRAARLRRAVVADKDQLTAEVEKPVGREQLCSRKRPGPDPEFVARRRGQRVQLRVGEHGPGVIAVESGPEVAEELGGDPGAQDQVRLDVRTRPGNVARLEGRAVVDVLGALKAENVAARAGDEADLVERQEVELHERRIRLLHDGHVLHPTCLVSLDGVGEHDVRRVDAVLKPRRRRERHPQRPILDLVLRVETRQDATVALIDHVTVFGIVEKEAEVVEETERVVARIGVRRQALGLGRLPAVIDIQIRPLRDAALVGVDRSEAVDQVGANRA